MKDRKEILENINNSIFKPFSLESLKLNTIEYLEYKQIQKLDEKINTTIFDEEIIRDIFPLSNMEENNKEFTYDKRLYEITNSTYPKIEKIVTSNRKPEAKIFACKKISKIMGRRRKNNQSELYSTEPNHTKFREDNIVHKIKIYFTNSTMIYINNKYFEYVGKKSKKRFLGAIKPNFTKVWTKKGNKEYLAKKIRDIFEEKLSNKCKRYSRNHNQKQIQNLIKNNDAKEIIDILNTTVKDMYEKYIGKNDTIPGYNLENDLKKIEQRNGKEYAEKYKNTALNLIEILNKKGRKE